jgi:hypothetical protein
MSLMLRRHIAVAVTLSALGWLAGARAQEPAPNPLLDEFVWRPIGPTNMGGRIDDVEAVETDPSTIYVGAATSGVWKTDNNGTTWLPVFDAQPNLSIGDIAIAPSNPNIVWVGQERPISARARRTAVASSSRWMPGRRGPSWAFATAGRSAAF